MSEWNKKRDVMRNYNLTAHLYDMRYAEEQKVKFEAIFKNLKLKEKSLILDVGCGTGLLFNYIADKAETVIGLDISKKTLFEACKRWKKFSNLQFILADADNIPFKDGVFTHVFAVTLIQNMPYPIRTLREIKRVTVNEGFIAVTVLKKTFSPERFIELLRKAGLKIVALEVDGEKLKGYVAVCKVSNLT
ncbi:class I SAM-dependent methyltransferase [Candidatus Bathyarchaeota archaeon]|nr:MAG: class I SAM-dependent methyltransferase [Candidatus Bathyarchaeota archaeon]